MFTKAALSSTRSALVLTACLMIVAAGAGPALSANSQTQLAVTPTFFPTIHNATHNPVTSVVSGTTIHDTETLSSLLGAPTRTVSFTWFGKRRLRRRLSPAGSASVDATGFADGSSAEGPLAPGDYSFRAHFTSFATSSWTNADSECELLHVTAVAASALTATATPTRTTPACSSGTSSSP